MAPKHRLLPGLALSDLGCIASREAHSCGWQRARPGRANGQACSVASKQVHRMRCEQTDSGEENAKASKPKCEPGQNKHACYDGRRRQYDANLERGRSDLVVVI